MNEICSHRAFMRRGLGSGALIAAMLIGPTVPTAWAQTEAPAAAAPATSRKVAAKPAAKLPSAPKATYANVSYGPHERNVIDFWQAESMKPTPLVVFIHGGGWQNGDKGGVSRTLDMPALLKAGISVAAINYRFVKMAEADGVVPPVKGPLSDAARAIQFLRSKAGEWNIDKERIGATGGSAGACTSLWLAFHDDMANAKSDDAVSRESTRLKCAAVLGAQTTLDPQQMKEWTPNSKYGGHAFGVGAFPNFLAERERILPWISEYSPYALVSADDPSILLIYNAPPALGEEQKDPTHTSNFGVKLQERCKAAGVACELKYPGSTELKYANVTEYFLAMFAPPSTEKPAN